MGVLLKINPVFLDFFSLFAAGLQAVIMKFQQIREKFPHASKFNVQYTFKKPRYQAFPFPYPMMRDIALYASGKVWKKLFHTCKYFYLKKAVYPVSSLKTDDGWLWKADGKYFNFSGKILSKLWLYNEYFVDSTTAPGATSLFLSTVSKCNFRVVHIQNQILTLKEYQMLTSHETLEFLYFYGNTVKDINDLTVTFDKLIANLEQLKVFRASGPGMLCKTDTVKKMIKIISGYKNLHKLALTKLPDNFDLLTFTEFLLKNESIDVTLVYDQRVPLFDATKTLLNNFVEKVVKSPPKKIPHIGFPEFDQHAQFAKYQKLCLNQKQF